MDGIDVSRRGTRTTGNESSARIEIQVKEQRNDDDGAAIHRIRFGAPPLSSTQPRAIIARFSQYLQSYRTAFADFVGRQRGATA